MLQDQEESFRFQVHRVFASLGRDLIVLIEDLKSTHDNNFEKLKNNLPPELTAVVDMSDYLDGNRYAWTRKRILDIVNSKKRDLESLVNRQ